MAASKILSGIKIEGKMSGDSDVKVEGEIYGEINLSSSIYIAQGGRADANIKAINVFVAGEFNGNIEAEEFIQISPNGRGKGELVAPAISIEKGAKFTGNIEMKDGDFPDSGVSAEDIIAAADGDEAVIEDEVSEELDLSSPEEQEETTSTTETQESPVVEDTEAPVEEESSGGGKKSKKKKKSKSSSDEQENEEEDDDVSVTW